METFWHSRDAKSKNCAELVDSVVTKEMKNFGLNTLVSVSLMGLPGSLVEYNGYPRYVR